MQVDLVALEARWLALALEDPLSAELEPGAGDAFGDPTSGSGIYLPRVELVFEVSSDEEYVHLSMRHDGRTIDMGGRAHNYLLLILARLRLADRTTGVPESSCGWASVEDWEHDPSLSPARLNLDVHRIRKHFLGRGVRDAARIIERRPRLGQLRIGAERISIVRT
jgi:hypothetical protein